MDLIDIARYFGALMLVLALLGLAALAARRFGMPGIVKGASTRRLSIAESLLVGPRTKLLLVRRDGTEHLILMTPQGATLVEAGIAAQSKPQPSPEPPQTTQSLQTATQSAGTIGDAA